MQSNDLSFAKLKADYLKQNHLGKITVVSTIVVGFLLLLILALTWPNHDYKNFINDKGQDGTGGNFVTEAATVVGRSIGTCDYKLDGKLYDKAFTLPSSDSEDCYINQAKIITGADKGKYTVVLIPTNRISIANSPDKDELLEELPIKPDNGQPDIKVGDKIRLSVMQAGDSVQYKFYDFVRGKASTFWLILFVLLVALVTGCKGVRALFGLGFAFLFIVFYMFPSILNGRTPFYVAIFSGICIMYVVILFTHGISMKTLSALWGTIISLLFAGALSLMVFKTMKLTGLSQEESISLLTLQGGISLGGVLLAAFVIGSLGVLNDTSISQASTVFELAKTKHFSNRRSLFTSGMSVGRDHAASQVYTLIFAYVGSALPYLLLFSVSGRSIADIAMSEIVAIELARIVVGSCGLILTVPLTTFIASNLAIRSNNTSAKTNG